MLCLNPQSKYLNSTVCGARDLKFLPNQKSCCAELCEYSFSFHSILCRKWSTDLVSTLITVLFLMMEQDWHIILHPTWRHGIDMFSMTWRKKKGLLPYRKGIRTNPMRFCFIAANTFPKFFFFLYCRSKRKIAPLAWDTVYLKKTNSYVAHMLYCKT